MGFELSAEGDLYYRLSDDEYVDADAYDMLRNNSIEHILSPTLKQSDANRLLVYDTARMVPSNVYFATHVFGLRQLVEVLLAATEAFIEAREYMLEEDSFAGSVYYLYLTDSLEARLVYTPVMGYKGCPGIRPFLLDLFVEMHYDTSVNDMGALARIYQVLVRDDDDDFTPQRLKRILTSLLLGAGTAAMPSAEGHRLTSADESQGTADAASAAHAVAPQVDLPGGAVGGSEGAGTLSSETTPQAQTVGQSMGVPTIEQEQPAPTSRLGGLFRQRPSRGAAKMPPQNVGAGSSVQAITNGVQGMGTGTGERGVRLQPPSVQPKAIDDAVMQSTTNEEPERMLIPNERDMSAGILVPSGGIQREEPSEGKKKSRGLFGKGNDKKGQQDTAGEKSQKKGKKGIGGLLAFGKTGDKPGGGEEGARAQGGPTQITPDAGGTLNASRSIVPYAALSIVTIGIYPIVFLYKMLQDVEAVCAGDGKNQRQSLVLYVLLMVVTFGFYGVFLRCRMAERMRDNAPRYGLAFKQGAVTTLLLDFVVPFVLNVLVNVLFPAMTGSPFIALMGLGVFGLVIYFLWSLMLWIGPLMAMNGLIKNCNELCAAHNVARNAA